MFRVDVFLQEMLEKVEKAKLLLHKESICLWKTKEEMSHIIK